MHPSARAVWSYLVTRPRAGRGDAFDAASCNRGALGRHDRGLLGPRHYDPHVTDGPGVRAEHTEWHASDADRCADARFSDVTSVPLAPNVEVRGRLLEIDFDAL